MPASTRSAIGAARTAPIRIALTGSPPTRPGLYLYHPAPADVQDVGADALAQASLINDLKVQLVVVERRAGRLVARLRTFDARTLIEPVTIPVDQVVGLWSTAVLPTIEAPEYPDAFRSIEA